ncbi:MAG TPA: TonB-dependent receptor [Candidatus Aquilonibacter sp.]|nr:TonB-dependent receptor [Candidatus Aquilonibacter sp.]
MSAGRWIASWLLFPAIALAQQAKVCVVDAGGRALQGADVTVGARTAQAGSAVPLDANACATVPPGRIVTVRLNGFAPATLAGLAEGTSEQVVMRPMAAGNSVTVTADRGLVGINDVAASVAVLDQEKLRVEPGLALDDSLHQIAGFQLFRRTSSWTANPTSSGVSLRGLGSTAASRTLVVSDEVPMNDPFGGWVHWTEIPPPAIQDVELIRGGSAELYGSSAIGGVIDIVPVEPREKKTIQVAADASGATENTALADGMAESGTRWIAALAAASELKTGGYITTAPALRGSVDVPTSVDTQSGRLELRTPPALAGWSAFLRGNVLNESRQNGTPLQTNATRLWRYTGGADADIAETHTALRLFGSREGYRQSFSSVAADRDSENLVRLQTVPTDEFGFVLQATRAFGRALTAALGSDMRDVRATDNESPVTGGLATYTTSISARQREFGGYADAIWQPKGWSLSGSVRVDSFRTFDAVQRSTTLREFTPLPEIDEMMVSPRVGLVRFLPHGLALTGTAFRAFRGPTMNELYRTSQVGQQTTIANNSLLAERATGFEFGAEFAPLRAVGHDVGQLRATYFWTEVNRPISAVLLSQTATSQLLQRQNLGQIRSRGLMLEGQSARWRGLDASFGYQLAIATVTAFNSSSSVQRNLTGKWIPEVPRESVTATANYTDARIANLHVIASYEGQEFDDALNQFRLHPYARFDVSADRRLRWGLSVFAGAQNLLNRQIDAGLTPILTLAAPRMVQAGMRYAFSR